MVQVLAAELNHFVLVLNAYLADGAYLSIFGFVVYRLVLPLGNLVEGYLIFIFFNFLEDSTILIEPFFCGLAAHNIKRRR